MEILAEGGCNNAYGGKKYTDHPGIGFTECGDNGGSEDVGWKGYILVFLEGNIREVLGSECGEQIAEIDCRLGELQQELLYLAKRNKGMLQMRFINCESGGWMF